MVTFVHQAAWEGTLMDRDPMRYARRSLRRVIILHSSGKGERELRYETDWSCWQRDALHSLAESKAFL